MDPNFQTQPPPQPIRDVAPPHDSLGNPESPAQIPVRQAPDTAPAAPKANPIIGAGPTQEAVEKKAVKGEELDKVLKDVNKEVKAATQKPHLPSKPVMAITVAILAAIILSIAAYFAFRKPS